MERNVLGKPISYWIEGYGLPLHLYDGEKIKSNLLAFKNVFQEYYPMGHIRYAAKALTHPAVMSIVKEAGCGADCASYNEVKCCLDVGIDPEKIDLNGNCKEDFLIEDAVDKDMLIVADSIEEFDLVARIAGNRQKKVRVLLRVSGYNLEDVTAASVFTAGRWTKFGTPVSLIPSFIEKLKYDPYVDFLGFHTHIGSQITEVEPYLEVLGQMCRLGQLLNKTEYECRMLNIGGGFPVSYLTGEEWTLFMDKVRRGIEASEEGDESKLFVWDNRTGGFRRGADGRFDFSKWAGEKFYSPYPREKMLKALLTGSISFEGGKKPVLEALKELGNPALVAEPGRSIAEDSGITLSKVGHVRKIAGHHNMITLEMGVMDHCDSLVEPSIKRWELFSGNGAEEPFEAFVGGNLCFSGDMICRYKITLNQRPKRGDILMARDTGAYCSCFMASNANSFPRPPRVLVAGGKEILMKERDSYCGIFS